MPQRVALNSHTADELGVRHPAAGVLRGALALLLELVHLLHRVIHQLRGVAVEHHHCETWVGCGSCVFGGARVCAYLHACTRDV